MTMLTGAIARIRRSKVEVCGVNRGVVAALFFAGAVGVCQADASFSKTDWSSFADETTVVLGSVSTGALSSEPTGGNPGSWLEVDETSGTGPFNMWLGVTEDSWVYNPSTEGAISSIDISGDVLGITGPSSIAFQALILQNGNYYFGVGGFVSTATGNWETSAASGLLSGSWAEINPGDGSWDYSQNPDFSSSAAPITFGYVEGVNGTSPTGGNAAEGFDNVNIDVHTAAVPEPAPLFALGAGVGLLALRRRRR
jgi:hypothetical protein